MGGQRRRGDTLEQALLAAAWAELSAVGYAALSIDGVARRAQTSRTVLYRRWPSKALLAKAAIEQEIRSGTGAPEDTGSLRGDVIAVLTSANARRVRLALVLLTNLSDYYQANRTSPAKLAASLYEGDPVMDVVIARAVERGELRPGAVPPRVARVPIDLFRHEVVMTLAPVPEPVIVEIVDTIFLPLLRASGAMAREQVT